MIAIALAGLLARRLRLILTAVTIIIGVAFVAGTLILTGSLQNALRAPAAAAAVVVVQPGAGKGGGPADGTVPAVLAARVRAVPGVAAAQGLVSADKVTLIGRNGRPINHVRAVSELRSYPADPALAAQYTIEAGRPPRRPGQAMIDAATARRLHYRVGDPVGIVTPGGVRTLTVTGITGFDGAPSPVADQTASFDTPTVVVVPAATAQQLAGLPGRFTEIDARAAGGVGAAALRDRIARVLPPGLTAITGQQAAAQATALAAANLGRLRTDLLAFCAMALLVAAFVIANTFAILAAQRGREHALLRILGASRGQLLRSVLAEATALGLTASAAGLGLGILAAAGLRGLISLLGGTLPAGGLVVPPAAAVIALATGTAVTVLAALRPARRAARVAPLRALREALPEPGGRSRRRAAAAAAGLGLAVGLVTAGLLTRTDRDLTLIVAGALAGLAAVVAAGPLLAGPLARVIAASAAHGRGPGRPGGITTRLACDNTIANPSRTAATAATLVVGLAIAATGSIIAASASASVQDAISGGSHADLYVQGQVSPLLTRQVAARPGVRAVLRVDDPLVDIDGTTARVAGLDPASAATLLDLGARGGALAALRGDRLLVSAGQAAAHRWTTGSHVVIDFGQGAPRTLTVAGIFTDKRFLGDDYVMPITALFRDLPSQQELADSLLVRVSAGASPRAVRAAIAPLLAAEPGTAVQTAAQYERANAADLGDLSHILALITGLVVLTDLIAALGIASTVALSVTERTRELGVMRALGLTRRQLAATIRIEAVLTGLLGALPGTVLGVAAGAALAAALTRDQTGVATIRVPAGPIAALLAVSCLAAFLAAALPARHAARMPVLRAVSD